MAQPISDGNDPGLTRTKLFRQTRSPTSALDVALVPRTRTEWLLCSRRDAGEARQYKIGVVSNEKRPRAGTTQPNGADPAIARQSELTVLPTDPYPYGNDTIARRKTRSGLQDRYERLLEGSP